MPPAYSRPFRQGHKNDFRDAQGVAEAVERPSTRCVPIKTDEQRDLQALHRVRSRLIGNRTAVINQISAAFYWSTAFRSGRGFLGQQLPQILATRTDVLSPRMIRIIWDLMADWKNLDERIERVTDEIEALARADEGCRQLITVPGIGPATSRVRWWRQSALALPFAKAVILLPGLGWCRSKCRRVIAQSLAASPSAETAICACSSSKALVAYCCDQQAGRSIASDRGSPPQRGDYIAMLW